MKKIDFKRLIYDKIKKIIELTMSSNDISDFIKNEKGLKKDPKTDSKIQEIMQNRKYIIFEFEEKNTHIVGSFTKNITIFVANICVRIIMF